MSGFCIEPCTVAFKFAEPETAGGALFVEPNAEASATN